jgi:glycosyltransferase involved in cell wall biosynthesis
MKKTPVIIAGTNGLGGVTTWAEQLRSLLANHPRYVVRLVYIGPEEHPGDFDYIVPTVNDAHQLVRNLAPAIVIPNYVWELFLSGFEPGVRCIGMCHADSDEQYYRPLSWYEPLVSKFIAVSRECTARLTERIPLRAGEITTLPYGINVPPLLNRNYQVDPLRLIYAGRVTQLQKRVWDFVPLVANLLEAGVRFVFDIVGEGDEYAPLRVEMERQFPLDLVRFYSRKPHREMPRVWTSHDVFLQVSDFEGTSVSMLEAMAHGTVPVLTAASSGIEGVIQHGVNGFVAPVGDMVSLAQAVATLTADPRLLANTGRAAYASAQPYAMELYRERFTQFLDEVTQTEGEFDFESRYGMFGAQHPLILLKARLMQHRKELERLRRGAVLRLLDKGYRRLRPRKERQKLLNRSA